MWTDMVSKLVERIEEQRRRNDTKEATNVHNVVWTSRIFRPKYATRTYELHWQESWQICHEQCWQHQKLYTYQCCSGTISWNQNSIDLNYYKQKNLENYWEKSCRFSEKLIKYLVFSFCILKKLLFRFLTVFSKFEQKVPFDSLMWLLLAISLCFFLFLKSFYGSFRCSVCWI